MQKRTFTDQMGRDISLIYPPKRIISLVPSQTELLFDLGLDSELVGITKFCIHPRDKFLSTKKIGGTKKLDIQKIRDLKPDLIIGNKEENERGQIGVLMQEFPVWMSDIRVLDDAVEMIVQLGSLTGQENMARQIAAGIREGFRKLELCKRAEIRTAYFIWKDPYMLAGKNTFIDDVLQRAGFKNVVASGRYPEFTSEQVRNSDPDVIFLSSEPYPFKNEHVQEMKRICPGSEIIIVDGELFSWYGSRLLLTPGYLGSLADSLNRKDK